MEFKEKMKEAEFNSLRTELLMHISNARNASIVMYTGLFVLFAYLYSSKDSNPIGFILVIPFIYIFYIFCRKSAVYVQNIASYFSIFNEEYGLKWESRLCHNRDNDNGELCHSDKEAKVSRFDIANLKFIVPVCICYASYLFVFIKNKSELVDCIYIVFAIFGGILTFVIVLQMLVNEKIIDIRYKQDKAWIKIKTYEEKLSSTVVGECGKGKVSECE